jgi:hypothetical protein
MKTENGFDLQAIVGGLVLALLMNPLAYAMTQEPVPTQPSDPQSQNAPTAHDANSASATESTTTLPSASATQTTDPLPDSPGAVQKQSAQLVPPMPAPTPQEEQARRKEPVGTAAAETVPTMGVAASRPAGAALAPAKQRRVRTILIRMGAVIGVGAAVGVTMALSEGSPSKPPGAR